VDSIHSSEQIGWLDPPKFGLKGKAGTFPALVDVPAVVQNGVIEIEQHCLRKP
jgi:hypothetical protein